MSRNNRKDKKKERKIFLKLREGDKDAFASAYDLCVDEIYRFIFFKVNSAEDAQDLTSAVFLKAWNYIQETKLKDTKTLRALFYKIGRNLVIDHYRQKSNSQNISIDASYGKDGELKFDLPDSKQDVSKKVEINFDYEKALEKIKELKDEYREIIVLRFINELSVKEIAEVINKSNGNVRVLIYRALKVLKEISSK